jgi:hypothetical protein
MKLKPKHIFYLSSAFTLALLTSSCIPFGGSVGNSPVPTPNPNPTPTPTPTVTPVATGWNAITSPPTVSGRANNVGFTSDQLGNLYISYQGSESFTIYRYVFNQATLGWQQIASTKSMSLSSYSSSLAISAINTISLTYLYSPTPQVNGQINYLTALPDKIDFTSVSIPRTAQVYSYSGSKHDPEPACPAPIVHELAASEAGMALDPSDKQVIAYSDELQYDEVSVDVESGVCKAPYYNGGSTLGVYIASNYSTHTKLTQGPATQIKIVGTPTAVGSKYPLYIAYKDAAHNGGASVQKLTYDSTQLESYVFTQVGNYGFSGDNANYISLTVDTTGTPYVAYESSNQLLTVQKYNGSSWVAVGNGNITSEITTWVSLSMDIKTNTPYVAYQEGSYIKVKKFDGTNWVPVGGNIPNTPGNYGAYTNLILRQESINSWQPSLAFQATAPSQSTSSLSTLFYKP